MDLESQSQNIYDVQIGGCSLKLKTDQKSEKVNQLVKTIEGKIAECMSNYSDLSLQKALILSCLNLAEENFDLKQSTQKELDFMQSKLLHIKSLLKSLEN